MKHIDYIVVGLGIAGLAMCEQLQKNRKSFVVFSNGEGATSNSGGVINPTVLKRFTAAWNADTFYGYALPFYENLSSKLGYQVFNPTFIFRIFKSVEEQNDWAVASDKRDLSKFLSSEICKNSNKIIDAPLGFGKVTGAGIILPNELLKKYQSYLERHENFISEKFQYNLLKIESGKVSYKNFSAQKIIFCDGSHSVSNPFFPKHGIVPNKGEYITVRIPNLNFKELLKGPLYVIPLGSDLYKVGATYERDVTDQLPTAKARESMLQKLKKSVNGDIEVIDQTAGIRPTTRDRKPLLGGISDYENVYFFNGLGTRGFLMAPLLSEMLYNNIAHKMELPKEIAISRLTRN
ncbi:NAD(P)/FAD-dependent oxidoreductase [Aequorivita echinoideorum]|uniref:FAD-binding oxidoreductase n=1 Tax=Aequorivita echinoideorum TaxID=1549647 RepID=A0ABS5S0K5_9FLAO|nr:FAD-dependent oxidoreductase [Aequorivita echinoideorum]MBT0606748.1 FAD-binding oxidoreductase [Aequorivita echinoideorum]